MKAEPNSAAAVRCAFLHVRQDQTGLSGTRVGSSSVAKRRKAGEFSNRGGEEAQQKNKKRPRKKTEHRTQNTRKGSDNNKSGCEDAAGTITGAG